MNRPKRGRAPIKKSTNKKFNTLRKMIWKVKRKKKIKQKNKAQSERGREESKTMQKEEKRYRKL